MFYRMPWFLRNLSEHLFYRILRKETNKCGILSGLDPDLLYECPETMKYLLLFPLNTWLTLTDVQKMSRPSSEYLMYVQIMSCDQRFVHFVCWSSCPMVSYRDAFRSLWNICDGAFFQKQVMASRGEQAHKFTKLHSTVNLSGFSFVENLLVQLPCVSKIA